MAAGRSIGTVFLDYDVNFEPATRAQAKLLQDAKSTSLSIEQNWRNLGIKSGAEFDLMRQKIQNSYDMLASKFKDNASEMTRIEQARTKELTALNEQQFGKQTSLLQTAKQNWLAFSAGAVAAWYTVSKGFDAVADTINTFTKLADEVRNLSYLTGETPEKVSGLIDVMGDLGVSSDLVQTSIAKMSTALEKGSPSLDRLGVATRYASGEQKSALDIFYESIDALGRVENTLQRNRLAQELFGRGWTQMIPIIEQGSAALKEMASESNKILTAEDLKRAREYQLALANLGDSWEAFKITVGQGIIAPITFVIKWLTPKSMTPEQAAATLKDTQDWAAQFQAGPGGSGGLFGEGYATNYGAYEDASLHGGGYRAPVIAGPNEAETKRLLFVLEQEAKGMAELEKARAELGEANAKYAAAEQAKEEDKITVAIKQQAEGLADLEKARAELGAANAKYGAEQQAKDEEKALLAITQQQKGMEELEKARAEFGAWEVQNEQRKQKAFLETAAGRKAALDAALEAADQEARAGWITFEEATVKKQRLLADYYEWEERETDRLVRYQADAAERRGNFFKAGLLDSKRAYGTFTADLRRTTSDTFREVDRLGSDILFDGFTNGFKGMNDLVDDFGAHMLRVFTDLVASEATRALVNFLSPNGSGSLLSGLAGIIGSVGSAVGSFLGFFDTGVWKVPHEGAAILHEGELVLPAGVAEQLRAALASGGSAEGGAPGRGPQTQTEAAMSAIADAIGREYGYGAQLAYGLTVGLANMAIGMRSFMDPMSFFGTFMGMIADELGLPGLSWGDINDAISRAFGGEIQSEWGSPSGLGGLGYGQDYGWAGGSWGEPGDYGGWGGAGPAGPDSTSGGFGTSDTASPSNFAAGGLFTTRGRQKLIVGEAGAETVAILRNPRGAGGFGGVTINGPLIQNATITKDTDVAKLDADLGFVLESAFRRALRG